MTKRLLAILVLVCLANIGCGSGPAVQSEGQSSPAQSKKDQLTLSPAQQQEGGIGTGAVVSSNEPVILHVAGRIALADNRTSRVGVRTVGLVMEVYAGLGDYVKKGQILAHYHADEVRDTRALYRTATAELKRAQSGEALAARNYERAQTLLGLKAGSQQQVEQARQEVASAQAAMQSAQIEIDRTKDVLEDDLRVPADPTPGDELADQVPIIAPVSGYIIEKNITPGKTVELSTDTFLIGDLAELWMLASVRQEQLGELHIGQPAVITLPGMPERTFPGTITNLGQEVDESTRMMQVRVALRNRDNLLRPQMLANADIPIARRIKSVVVPSDAIQQIDGEDVVFVKSAPDRFSVRAVRAGETTAGKTSILDGLSPGEEIAVKGSFVLKSQLLKSTMESD